MKVELFLGDDAPVVEVAVRESLATLSQHAELEVLHLKAREASSIPAAQRYVQLLNASTPIRADVNRVSIMGWAFYLQVYWHLDDDPYGPTSMRDFHGSDFSTFFPALAVRERMVLVPQAQRSVPPSMPHDPALELYLRGDLISVDFADAAALRGALQSVSGAVQRELAREARQVRRQFPGAHPDTASLATELTVHPDDLTQALAADSAFAVAIDALDCKLDPSTIPSGRWTRVRLTVTNDQAVDLGRLDVVVAGPVRVRPEGLSVEVPASGTGDVDLSLNPEDAGEFPLEVRLSPPPDSPMREEDTVRNLWLVSEG